jgi:hypothetical protein
MNCKKPGCGNKQRIMPINGKGSFEGFDVFQCPSCKTVATTVRKSVSRRPINEVWPEGKPMRTAGKGAIPDAKHPRIKKAKCPACNIKINDQNKRGQPACGNCGETPSSYDPDSYETKSLVKSIDKFIEKAGAEILPCKNCGTKVPHFKSSPPTTQGLCSECVRTSLSKPNAVKKGLWNQQTACTDDKCGWKQPYDKNDSEKALLHSAINNCPKCKKPAIKKPFSPDF